LKEVSLEIKVNNLSDSQQEVEVSVPYTEITKELEDAYQEERKKISIDGFRKGKAPMGMIKKLYGEAIEYTASEKIANKKFWEAVDQENLKPISTPQMIDIDFVPSTKLTFKVKFDIKPKLELKNYKGIEIEKPLFKIKDEDIEKEIDYLLKPYLKSEPTEIVENQSCRIGVILQRLDSDGIPMVGTRNENMEIDLSDEKVNPQIYTNAQGKKVGDIFNFSFIDEHHHGEELHREEYNYTAEISKIEKIVRPEITEEIVKKISTDKASSLDEFRTVLHKNFEEYYTKQSDEISTNNLINEIVKNNDFVPPAGFVASVHKRFVEMEKENAKRYKMPNFNEEAAKEYYKPRAEWNAKWQIILENLAEIENIKVEDSEFEELAKIEAEKTGISIAKLIKYYKDTNRTEALLEEKIIKFLKENARLKK
jgi:trigger factor